MKAELLAPVGKMENAIAAVENGADALFVGGKLFNARQYADNFTDDELEEIVHYAKLRGVRVYVTVNILIKEAEVEGVYEYLKYLEEIGVHSIIVQDLGVAAIARTHFPKLRLHASTQLSAHSIEDVMFLKSLGFKRVVLARELGLKEIEAIIKTCGVEIETFVHGALCYSYSGQCLMSSLIGGRSGNRGRCAQTCRMKYSLMDEDKTLVKDAYLLSLKDICSIEFIPELLACGVHSFKMEGRMKSPEYVASVVRTYRKYVDLALSGEKYEVAQEDLDILKGVFNRGGFSKGYYFEHGTKKMLTPVSPKHIGLKAGVVTQFIPKTKTATILLERDLNPGDGLEIIRKGKESVGMGISKKCEKGTTIKAQFEHFVEVGSEAYLTKNHNLLKALRATYQKPQRKMPVHLSIIGKVGAPLEVSLTVNDKTVTYKGDLVENAMNAPLTKEQVVKQLSKLGSTSFVAKTHEIEWDENAYLPISQLNEVRRQAVSLLEAEILKVETKVHPEHLEEPVHVQKAENEVGNWYAHVTTLAQLEEVLRWPQIKRIYWEWQYNQALAHEALALCQAKEVPMYLAFPSIIKENTFKRFEADIKSWEGTGLTGYLVRTNGMYYVLKDSSKEIVIDYNLNIMNHETINLWESLGVAGETVSAELTLDEIMPLEGNLEKIVYGYIPVMTSQQCILRHTNNCQKKAKEKKLYTIKDRKETPWAIQTDCQACVMQILSYQPIVVKSSELQRIKNQMNVRLQFNKEDVSETRKVLSAYLEGKTFTPASLEGINFKGAL